MFGALATFLASKGRQAQTPDDLLTVIDTFLQDFKRPHEAIRQVLKLDAARDWLLGDFRRSCC